MGGLRAEPRSGNGAAWGGLLGPCSMGEPHCRGGWKVESKEKIIEIIYKKIMFYAGKTPLLLKPYFFLLEKFYGC